MKIRFLSFVVACFCVSVATVFAEESAGEIRRRMEQRLASIDALKAQDAVGENNRGFLEAPPAGKPGGESVIAEENRDREAVYALIAKQTGASVEAVGKARARKIAANTHPGVWLQDESGQWKKK